MNFSDFSQIYLTLAAVCFFFVLAVSAQQGKSPSSAAPPPSATPIVQEGDEKPISVVTDLVTMTLTVTDVYGRYISGLGRNAFNISDNNQAQNITFFSDVDAPISIGILFDISGSMDGEKIARSRKALERFINTSHPMDEYFLVAFNSRAQLLLDRTRNGEAVLNKMTMVKPDGNTALYDAAYLGVKRVERGAHQKKALLIISDGQDNSSRYNFGEVRRLLKESDVTVYSVGIMDGKDSGSMLGMQGEAFLDELSSVTGGKAFYPQTGAEMDEIFERIALELRHQYSIGYTPQDFTPNGKWRKVKVKIKPPPGVPHLAVRVRDGYYAAPNSTIK